MPDCTHEQLRQVFCDVLETLAFMFGESSDRTEVPQQVPSCIEASIRFAGPSAGTLTMLAPSPVAGELAANLLGLDAVCHEDELARDAIGELMNVTMGHLLTTIAGEAPVFDLSPPQVAAASPDRWPQIAESPQTVALIVEDNPVLLQLSTSDSLVNVNDGRGG
ncbi:MAG: chemotaxis protein CheX [bacterium]|nr:chemotaxis protein CheX [bacterium]